jgi:hypothetical protein
MLLFFSERLLEKHFIPELDYKKLLSRVGKESVEDKKRGKLSNITSIFR